MKKCLTIFLLILIASSAAVAQEDDKSWFDFWIGEWEVSWAEADGKTGSGRNTIVKTLDNVVIQENFEVREGAARGYLGTSLSVYSPSQKQWHQGYADNQGTYYDFIGEKEDEKRIFKTKIVKSGDKDIIQRMVFYEIKQDSLVWDWELSEDGGRTWKLNWRINYKRMGS